MAGGKRDLSYENINTACGEIEEFFKLKKADKRDGIRTRMLIEECLLNYREKFGEKTQFEIHRSGKLFKASILVIVYSEKFNPLDNGEEGIIDSIMTASTQQAPSWQYVKSSFEWLYATNTGRNEIVFSVPRESKTSNPVRILIGLGLGTLLALVLRLVLSAETCANFSNNYILPIANIYTGVLNVMAILMIFFAVPLCIVQYRNAADFQNATKKTAFSFVRISIFFALIVVLACVGIYGLNEATDTKINIFKSLYDVIVGFFPTSLIEPFITFNSMQVMIIGLLFGFAFLAMGERSKETVKIFDQVNLAAVLTNSFLNKFAFVYVFFMMFHIVLASDINAISQWATLILIVIAVCVLCVVISTAVVCCKFKITPKKLFKKLMPSFLINLSSASIGASFMQMFEETNQACGVEIGYLGVALNLGTVLNKPMYSAFLAAASCAVAHANGNLTVQLAIEILFLSILLPATIPNIPGGAASVIVVMISQLGFGAEYAELLVSLNALLQYVIVPVNAYCTQCAIIVRAAKVEQIDINILTK